MTISLCNFTGNTHAVETKERADKSIFVSMRIRSTVGFLCTNAVSCSSRRDRGGWWGVWIEGISQTLFLTDCKKCEKCKTGIILFLFFFFLCAFEKFLVSMSRFLNSEEMMHNFVIYIKKMFLPSKVPTCLC